MKKFLCIVYDSNNNIKAVQFESNEVQQIAPEKLEEENLPESGYFFPAIFAENYCIWDTELSSEDNFFLLERELQKARIIYDNHDYEWILWYLMEAVNYKPHHIQILKSFGSLEAYNEFLNNKNEEFQLYIKEQEKLHEIEMEKYYEEQKKLYEED